MKRKATIILLSFLTGYTGCRAQDNQKAVDEAVSAAEEWLALVDNEKYGESWDEAAEYFKTAVSRDQWIQSIRNARKPHGKILSRVLVSGEYKTTLPGVPEGEYVLIKFKASFEKRISLTESITPQLDKEGKWRVSGYYFR